MNERYLEGSEELVAQLTEWRIAEARAKLRVAAPAGFDGTCTECGLDVPAPRLALGFYNCVDCQEDCEKAQRGKHYLTWSG